MSWPQQSQFSAPLPFLFSWGPCGSGDARSHGEDSLPDSVHRGERRAPETPASVRQGGGEMTPSTSGPGDAEELHCGLCRWAGWGTHPHCSLGRVLDLEGACHSCPAHLLLRPGLSNPVVRVLQPSHTHTCYLYARTAPAYTGPTLDVLTSWWHRSDVHTVGAALATLDVGLCQASAVWSRLSHWSRPSRWSRRAFGHHMSCSTLTG